MGREPTLPATAGTVRSGRPCAAGLEPHGARSPGTCRACSPASARWARAGPEDGPPALVIPGFLATDRTTMDLRRALARAGWRAHPWLLGLNTRRQGRTRWTCSASGSTTIDDGRPVLVVGWSLGGMFARELAHRCPDKVRAVVTLGSPFSGDLKTNTNVREYYERIAGPRRQRAAVPATSTASRRCRRWPSGRGGTASSRRAPRAGCDHEVDKAVEIDTYHMGFAVYRPALSQVVARNPDLPDRRWKAGRRRCSRYRPPSPRESSPERACELRIDSRRLTRENKNKSRTKTL